MRISPHRTFLPARRGRAARWSAWGLSCRGDLSHRGDLSRRGALSRGGALSCRGALSRRGDLSRRGGLSRGGALSRRGGLSRRAVTLIELLVTLVILTALIGSTLYAVSTARRVRTRNEILTALTLRANSDLARLRAEPWDSLREGTRRLEDPARPDAAGQAEVRDVPGLALKEITVQWRLETPAGPCRVTLATWRDRASDR